MPASVGVVNLTFYQLLLQGICFFCIIDFFFKTKFCNKMNRISHWLILWAMVLVVYSCGQGPAGDQVAASEAKEVAPGSGDPFFVDTQKSMINWQAAKLIGGGHNGYILLNKGAMTVNQGQITGGEFIIDMNSITNVDQKPGEGKEDLEAHLKDSDFFEVATYPTGVFTITSVSPLTGNPDATHTITGNLMLKGITKSISVPAKIDITDTEVKASTPQFTIDRTQWNVMFHAGVLGTAKDDIINDQVGIQLELVARK
jgi:polyisoprenoid-binding protein YceI